MCVAAVLLYLCELKWSVLNLLFSGTMAKHHILLKSSSVFLCPVYFPPKWALILNRSGCDSTSLCGIVIFVSTKMFYFKIVIYRHNGATSLSTKELLSFAMSRVFPPKRASILNKASSELKTLLKQKSLFNFVPVD